MRHVIGNPSRGSIYLPRTAALRQGPLRRMGERAGSWLFPKRCPVTSAVVPQAGVLSPEGWSKLTFVADPSCQGCGVPFAKGEGAMPLCAACAGPETSIRNLIGRRKLDKARASLVYDSVSAKLVLSLKYADRHDIGVALGELLPPAIDRLDLDRSAILVPIPLHPKRLRSRRYNQSLVLARGAARLTGHAVAPELLKRTKPTAQQKGRGFEARFRNLSGAFEASLEVAGRDIILVDDVLTSGATLIAAARALRRAGAKTISAVTAARVVPNAKDPDIDLPEL
ncbi:MAG: phosphoribosyltransferase family protein [Pseudomonadota bacterium]